METNIIDNSPFDEYVEIRTLYNIPSLNQYKDWTKVSRFLATGLVGIEVREINNDKNK